MQVLTTRPPSGSGPVRDPLGVRGRRWPVLRDAGGNVRGYVQFASFDVPLLLRLLFAAKPDAVVVEPPPTTGTVVRLVCAVRRIPYLYYAGDVSSRAAEGIGVPPAVVAVLRRVESWAMSGCGGPGRLRRRRRGGRPPNRRFGAHHGRGDGVDTEVFTPDASWRAASDPTLVYAGTMSEIQGASVWVEAFAQVADEFPDATIAPLRPGCAGTVLRRLATGLAARPGRLRGRRLRRCPVATALSSGGPGSPRCTRAWDTTTRSRPRCSPPRPAAHRLSMPGPGPDGRWSPSTASAGPATGIPGGCRPAALGDWRRHRTPARATGWSLGPRRTLASVRSQAQPRDRPRGAGAPPPGLRISRGDSWSRSPPEVPLPGGWKVQNEMPIGSANDTTGEEPPHRPARASSWREANPAYFQTARIAKSNRQMPTGTALRRRLVAM